jgi:hypothetical protein
MLFHRPSKLACKAVIRSYKISAYQEKNERCSFEVTVYFVIQVLSWTYLSVVPDTENTVPFEDRKVLFDRSAKSLIAMRVRNKRSDD